MIRVNKYETKYNIEDNFFHLKIIDIRKKENMLVFTFKGKEKVIGKIYLDDNQSAEQLYSSYDLGDYVYVEGNLKEPNKNTIPNTFNYKEYLNNNKIFYILEIEEIKLIKKNNNIFYELKNNVRKRIEKLENKSFIYAFVLGNTNYIDDESTENFRINGISHLFAISGMHVSFLCSILFLIFGYFRIEEIKKYYITFIILLIFAFLTGFSPSILRSALFFFLSGLNSLKRLKINSLTILLLVLIILLIINPCGIYSISLRLSFIVTFFLIYYTTEENEKYFYKLFKTSLISFFASLPLIINLNYEVNILSVINNLIFVPLVSIFVYPLCIFNFIFPFLSTITNIFINILINLNDFCSNLAINLIFPKFPSILLIPYYGLLILYKYKRKKQLVYLFLIVILTSYFYKKFDDSSYIYFLDVGQGDATLIVNKYCKKVILIDTGGSINYDGRLNTYLPDNMITFFKSIGIRKIDYLFLTHSDFDHSGNAIYLKENFTIKNIFINNGKLENGTIFTGSLKINDVIIQNLNDKIYDNENENSLILLINISNKNILIMGDATIKNEKDLIKKYDLNKIDILKVGHHGSSTSTSSEFIEYARPIYSVISVGKNNRYNHPSKDVLEILKDSKVYRTDQEGSIMFKIKSSVLQIKTCEQ